jgi:hypothetical protein
VLTHTAQTFVCTLTDNRNIIKVTRIVTALLFMMQYKRANRYNRLVPLDPGMDRNITNTGNKLYIFDIQNFLQWLRCTSTGLCRTP